MTHFCCLSSCTVKVNLSPFVEQYRGAEVYVSGWPNALVNLPLRNECLEPLEYEAERATEPIWTWTTVQSVCFRCCYNGSTQKD